MSEVMKRAYPGMSLKMQHLPFLELPDEVLDLIIERYIGFWVIQVREIKPATVVVDSDTDSETGSENSSDGEPENDSDNDGENDNNAVTADLEINEPPAPKFQIEGFPPIDLLLTCKKLCARGLIIREKQFSGEAIVDSMGTIEKTPWLSLFWLRTTCVRITLNEPLEKGQYNLKNLPALVKVQLTVQRPALRETTLCMATPVDEDSDSNSEEENEEDEEYGQYDNGEDEDEEEDEEEDEVDDTEEQPALPVINPFMEGDHDDKLVKKYKHYIDNAIPRDKSTLQNRNLCIELRHIMFVPDEDDAKFGLFRGDCVGWMATAYRFTKTIEPETEVIARGFTTGRTVQTWTKYKGNPVGVRTNDSCRTAFSVQKLPVVHRWVSEGIFDRLWTRRGYQKYLLETVGGPEYEPGFDDDSDAWNQWLKDSRRWERAEAKGRGW